MGTAFVFPGQGSQAVGMGKALADGFPAAKAVFDQVNEALGEDLTAIIWDGPDDALTLTRNAQPALMAVSLATFAVLKAECGLDPARDIQLFAGHSLGEYSALTAAGTLALDDAARLLRIRGDAMQAAVPVGEGAMAAILNLDVDVVAAIAAEASEGDVCAAANDNAPGQVVVSGTKAAVERAVGLAKGRGARRAMLLPVSAPFHCALMQPAADRMAEALAEVAFSAPVAPIVVNVLAAPESDPEALRQHLVTQVTGAVRWRESVEMMAGAGMTRFVEVGAGKVLSGMIRRMAKDAETAAVGTPNDIEAMRGTFGG